MVVGKSSENVPVSSSFGCTVAAGNIALARRLRVWLAEERMIHDGDAPSSFQVCNKKTVTGRAVGAAERIVSLPYLQPREMDYRRLAGAVFLAKLPQN